MAREKLNIFLSASIPSANKNHKYFETADVIAIRDAVLALARVAMPTYRIIWGGHPSITPLIAKVLKHYGHDVQDCVTLYQSRYFERFFPLENESVANIIKTSSIDNDREKSLGYMRERMIDENDFYAGIFIGGMEGVELEYNLFTQKHPEAKVFPVASTGAAAQMLFEEHRDVMPCELLTELTYTSLFKKLLNL